MIPVRVHGCEWPGYRFVQSWVVSVHVWVCLSCNDHFCSSVLPLIVILSTSFYHLCNVHQWVCRFIQHWNLWRSVTATSNRYQIHIHIFPPNQHSVACVYHQYHVYQKSERWECSSRPSWATGTSWTHNIRWVRRGVVLWGDFETINRHTLTIRNN